MGEATGIVIVLLLFAPFESPGVETVAVFVTLGDAGALTATVMLTEPLALAARIAGLVQVTVCAATLQLHPAPLNDW